MYLCWIVYYSFLRQCFDKRRIRHTYIRLAGSRSALTLWSLCFWLINHSTVISSKPQTLTNTNYHEASFACSENSMGLEQFSADEAECAAEQCLGGLPWLLTPPLSFVFISLNEMVSVFFNFWQVLQHFKANAPNPTPHALTWRKSHDVKLLSIQPNWAKPAIQWGNESIDIKKPCFVSGCKRQGTQFCLVRYWATISFYCVSQLLLTFFIWIEALTLHLTNIRLEYFLTVLIQTGMCWSMV